MEMMAVDEKVAAVTATGTLKILHLRVAAMVMAQKDIRYYLNGVQFEVHKGAVLTIATDGHRLIVCRHESSDIDIKGGPLHFFLERDQVQQIISAFKAYERTLPVVSFTVDRASGMVEVTGASNIRLSLLANADTAATFPGWRRIMTTAPKTGRPAQYDPHYLCDCAKIASMVNRKPVLYFEHNGDEAGGDNHGAARITFGDPDIVMALMPYKVHSPTSLAWLDEMKPAKDWK